MPGWKADVGRWLDALIGRTVPGVKKAVRWNSPFYGVEGRGWFLGVHCLTKYISVAFFKGSALTPLLPESSNKPEVRYFPISLSPHLLVSASPCLPISYFGLTCHFAHVIPVAEMS